MKTFSSYKKLITELKNRKGSLGLVPTMGSLHDGHISLVEKAIQQNANVIVSIFINPTQFERERDLKNYPVNLNGDLNQLKSFNNVLVFVPSIKELYPNHIEAKEYDFGKIDKIMEGKARLNHFNGVATIVEKLIYIFKPDFAYFGEKDFQQLAIIKSLINQIGVKTKIISCPTIREDDGLAMSSRNQLLNKEDRKKAILLYKALLEAKELMHSLSPLEIEKTISAKFTNIEHIKLQYFNILTDKSFSRIKNTNYRERYRAFIACQIGNVRLIDNIVLE